MSWLYAALTVMTIELASVTQHHMGYGVQLRGQGGGDPWVQAAKRVAGTTAVIDSLFKHYVALVDLATNYNTQERSNSWRKDQGYIGAQVCDSFSVMLSWDCIFHASAMLRFTRCYSPSSHQ